VDQTQLKKFCRAMRIDLPINKKKGWVQGSCPMAEWKHETGGDRNPSFGIEVKAVGISSVHCFACGFAGSLWDLTMEIRQLSGRDRETYDFKTTDEEDQSGLEMGYLDEDEEQFEDVTHYFSEDWLDSFRSVENFEDAVA